MEKRFRSRFHQTLVPQDIESHQSKFSLAKDGVCRDKLLMMSPTLKMRTLITSAGSMGTTITTTAMCASGAWRATER